MHNGASTARQAQTARTAVPQDRAGRRAERRDGPTASSDRFFRHLVFNLRNGVLAITRDGRVAAMNDIAYRVLGLPPRPDDHRPAVRRSAARLPGSRARAAAGVRQRRPAEPRRNAPAQDRPAIGYTLSHIHDDDGRHGGRDAVLQGPDARRADRRARAPARPARRRSARWRRPSRTRSRTRWPASR